MVTSRSHRFSILLSLVALASCGGGSSGSGDSSSNNDNGSGTVSAFAPARYLIGFVREICASPCDGFLGPLPD